jgi:enterochelin esterase family protein
MKMRFIKSAFSILLILTSACITSQLQAAGSQWQLIISPEVHSDGRVTFRLNAPNAKRVGVNAQFEQAVRPMTRSKSGVWSITLGPAEPEIYEYNFVVDGLQIVDPANSWLKVWIRNTKNLVEIPGKEPMFFQQQNVPHGTVHLHKYHSKTLGITRSLYIYTPPGYETNENTRYPVLYLFHGMGDTEDAWTGVGRANFIVDNLLAAKKAKPLVIVMPYGHTPAAPPDMRSIGNYGAFEKDLIKDIIPYVQKRYRVSKEQKDRAIAGLSMGGGQSLTIGMGNIELFRWIGAFSSAVPKSPKLEELLSNVKAKNDKLNLLWLGCGNKDFLFKANQKLITQLNTRKIKHVAHITDGGHEWCLWRRYLNEFVPLLFRND